jgi:hypothetical protein
MCATNGLSARTRQANDPNLCLAEAGVKDSKNRTVGYNDCFSVKELGQITQVRLNPPFGLLERPTHEWQRVLIANERKLTGLDPSAVQRLKPLGP